MRMRLLEFQDNDKETKKLRLKGLSKGWENIKEVFYYQDFKYILKVIHLELISKHHDDPLVDPIGIEKT